MRPLAAVALIHCLAVAFPYAAHSAVPDPDNSPTGEIVKFGICEQLEITERYSQPDSAAGYATNGELTIGRETENVPLQLGIGFGFAWRARNLPWHTEVTYLVEHPPIKRPDGIIVDHAEEQLAAESQEGVVESIDCYMLSEEHELVPGEWTISILHKGRLLVRRTFHIQPAQ